jgi:hypothetical protein
MGSGPCSTTVIGPRNVTLTATPDSGYILVGWTGGCIGAETARVFVNRPRTCSAVFDEIANRTVRTFATLERPGNTTGALAKVIFPATSITATYSPFDRTIWIRGQEDTESLELRFMPSTGGSLAPGTYLDIADQPSSLYPSIQLYAFNGSCWEATGRFTIRELVITSGMLVRFSADFELNCDDSRMPRALGVVRFDSIDGTTVPFDGALAPYRLTIVQPGPGVVVGPGLQCGLGNTACEATFAFGTNVTLAAQPGLSYVTAGWTGSCRGQGGGRATVRMNSQRQCGALFAPLFTTSPRSLLLLKSTAGVFSGGATTEMHSSDLQWSAAWSSTHLEVVGHEPSVGVTWEVELGSLTAPASVGTYTLTGGSGPRLWIFGPPSFYCFAESGQFTVLELARGTGPTVDRLSAEFEARCSSMANNPVIRGRILFNAVGDISAFVPGPAMPGGLRIVR